MTSKRLPSDHEHQTGVDEREVDGVRVFSLCLHELRRVRVSEAALPPLLFLLAPPCFPCSGAIHMALFKRACSAKQSGAYVSAQDNKKRRENTTTSLKHFEMVSP